MGKLRSRGYAVLFDLDGVLIDSPPIHAWAWAEIFRPFGIVLPPERLHWEEGRRSEEIAAGIVAEFGLVISKGQLAALLRRKRQMYRDAAPRGMRRDSRQAVEELRASGWRIGLVSGSARENVVGVLPEDEVALFDALVSAEEYARGKPDPEPYLVGCRRLGVEPSAAFAVENAPLGIASAKAAGLFVVGVTTTLPAGALSEADELLTDVTGLVRLLKALTAL